MPKRSRASSTEFETSLAEWVNERTKSYDASHDSVHASNVARLSSHIMQHDLPNADKFIRDAVIGLAWTHDVCDRKYNDNKKNAIDQVVNKCKDLKMSLKAVKIIEKVLPHISFSKRLEQGEPTDLTKTELTVYHLVSDADMLEAMGAIGVVRTFMYQAVMNNPSQSALTHITSKLFQCNDYLTYPWSKAEGAIRLARMKRICEELEHERFPV